MVIRLVWYTQQMQMSKLQMLTPTQNEFLLLSHHNLMPNKTSLIYYNIHNLVEPLPLL